MEAAHRHKVRGEDMPLLSQNAALQITALGHLLAPQGFSEIDRLADLHRLNNILTACNCKIDIMPMSSHGQAVSNMSHKCVE